MYYLFESSIGFLLFKGQNIDLSSLSSAEFQKDIQNYEKAKTLISFENSMLFQGHNVATETVEDIMKGGLPANLTKFLRTTFPKKSKRSLALQDKTLANTIKKELKIKVVHDDRTREVFRAIRTHLPRFLRDNLEEQDQSRGQQVAQANLGLGHALARKNIKFDEKRQDKGIINSYSLLEQIEKNLNTFAMRVKEWYAWHFPELGRLVADNEAYVRFVMTVGHRDNLKALSDEDLEDLVGDADLGLQIRERVKTSMGNDLLEVDEANLMAFAEYTAQHFQFKKDLQSYLRGVMEGVAPNLTELLGETVGAKILTQAGGLGNLAKLPASTIQILGAEKALFRALKTKSATPKFGHLYNSTFIGKARTGDKGKVSRCLANKCALASRLDHFLIRPSNRFGQIFKKQVQDRVDGVEPTPELSKRNLDEMGELVDELKSNGLYFERKKVKTE